MPDPRLLVEELPGTSWYARPSVYAIMPLKRCVTLPPKVTSRSLSRWFDLPVHAVCRFRAFEVIGRRGRVHVPRPKQTHAANGQTTG